MVNPHISIYHLNVVSAHFAVYYVLKNLYFLVLLLISQNLLYRNKISSLSAGANINNIKPASFDLINIPIPPLAEQKIIAEKLDTLLAQVDSTKARFEQIPQILKRFRQAVLGAQLMEN